MSNTNCLGGLCRPEYRCHYIGTVDDLNRESEVTMSEDATHPAHYAKCVIEPLEYITKNNLGFCEGNIVKYVTRWKNKNGVEDLEKAKYYLEKLIEEYSTYVSK